MTTDEPKIAKTWDECAQHVEAGGVVQLLHTDGKWRVEGVTDGKWRVEGVTAINYPERTGTPGDGWYQPRRLMPLPTPEGMSPGPEVDGRPTWYGTVDDAKAAGMTEARVGTKYKWTHIDNWGATVIVQARYPLPPSKPKTVRAHWSAAAGREDPHDGEIIRVEKIPGLMPRVNFAGDGWMDVTSPDGTVEVLAKDGES